MWEVYWADTVKREPEKSGREKRETFTSGEIRWRKFHATELFLEFWALMNALMIELGSMFTPRDTDERWEVPSVRTSWFRWVSRHMGSDCGMWVPWWGKCRGYMSTKEAGQRSHLINRIRRHLPGAEWVGMGQYYEEGSKSSRQIVQRPEEKVSQKTVYPGQFYEQIFTKFFETVVKTI